MAYNREKEIFVYESFSSGTDILLGILYVDHIRGAESYAFEFDENWLNANTLSVSIDPDLKYYPGRQYPNPSKPGLFGIFADSAPDRWGRMLMNRRERMIADSESRKPRKLFESDYLLGVFDETRMGCLRFKTDKNGEYLSHDSDEAIPPWTRLRTLEEASRNIETSGILASDKWLNQLIRPGSSLGGARPKANVADAEGSLWIAKFPSRHDDNDSGAWEMVAHDLAEMCGLNVPEAKLEKFSRYGSTYLVKRFDRDGDTRMYYSSAMTLLGKTDGASAADGSSYLDIVSFIRANGGSPKGDLRELWKRIVFSMAITNTDYHLRNHAFLLSKNGWELSPMFDVNPMPYGNELSLNVDENDNRISTELAITVAERFGISKTDAQKIAKEIIDTVDGNWEKLALKHGLSHAQIEEMKPAFARNI